MKKHYTITFLFLLLFYTASAQDKKWSVEVSYPIYLNSENISPDTGILDLGIRYLIDQNGSTHFGVGINGMLFSENEQGTGFSGFDFDVDYSTVILQPKVYAHFQFKKVPKFSILTGMGYSFIFSNTKGMAFDPNGDRFRVDLSDNGAGLNGFLGVYYDLNDKLYLQTQFDYIHNWQNDLLPLNLYLLKVGVGFRF